MSEKMDRRQARTKLLLYKALMELLSEKTAEAITVTDIATRADINRGTFYLHYRDVPDMLEQIKDQVFSSIESRIILMDPSEVMKYGAKDEPYPVAVMIFEEVARHADFLSVMFGPHGDISYAIRFKTFISRHIYNKLTLYQPDTNDLLVPRDYLIAYMASANLGILMHWLDTGMQQTPYQLGRMITQIVNHGPIYSAGLRDKT